MPEEIQDNKSEVTTKKMPSTEKKVAALPDKEVKPETKDTSSKTEKTTSTGEYSDNRKAVMGHMQSYYGEDEKIDDANYQSKMEGMITKDYGPTKEKNGKYEAANKNVRAMMQDNPEFGGVLSDMGRGAKFGQIANKYFDLQALIDSKGGDEESYAANEKTRMGNFNNRQERTKLLADNEEKSLKVIDDFKKEMKMDGENADKFGNFVADILDAGNANNITKEFLQKMYHAMNYENDVDDAGKAAEIKGKNVKIGEKMKSEEDIKKGDGTPVIESGGEEAKDEGSGDELADMLEKGMKKQGKRRF